MTTLAALPGAVADLQRFTNFAQVFGVTGLPYAQVLQAFDVSSQWSTMREASSAWDAFAQTQEGISWGMLRAIMERMGPLFEIAAGGDPSLPVTFPSLATLLGAKKAIARKAVATRKLNDEAEAKGLPRTHGVAGKRRKKAADKAIVAAASNTPGASAPTAPAPLPAVATPAAPAGAGTNGAPHP